MFRRPRYVDPATLSGEAFLVWLVRRPGRANRAWVLGRSMGFAGPMTGWTVEECGAVLARMREVDERAKSERRCMSEHPAGGRPPGPASTT